MQITKMGAIAAVVVAAVLALLYAVGVLERGEVGDAAVKAFAGLAVFLIAAAVLRLLATPRGPDPTDRPVP